MTLKLTRLLNADGEVVGYFSDHVAEMAARKEWDEHRTQKVLSFFGYTVDPVTEKSIVPLCRSVETPIASAELENVEPGDADRVDYVHRFAWQTDLPFTDCVAERVGLWLSRGVSSVEVQRFQINKYRRPGKSSRDADLGGPAEAAGVLYVLKVRAPR